MNKNFAIVALIFLVPLVVYWTASKDKNVGLLPTIAFSGPEIIKFSSPMCYECQELDKIFEEVYPGFANKISLRKINVTTDDKSTKELIKKYEVKLVPTCIFKNEDGNVIRKTEGNIQPKILENYMKELLNG
jgi:thiol-disulfide isomerase/thioredoxin